MTENIKPGMTEGIKPGTKESIKLGMGCLVMLRMGSGVPAGRGEGDLKGGGDVAGFLFDGEFGLGAGAAGPEKDVGATLNRGRKILSSTFGLLRMTITNTSGRLRMTGTNTSSSFRMIGTNTSGPFRIRETNTFGSLRMTKSVADCLGEDFGLVVAAGAAAGPVEGDGDDQVHVGEVRGGGQAAAQQAAVEAPGGEVAVILQGAGNSAAGAFVVHEGDGIGIVHALIGGPVTFEDGVEAVGQGVVGR
jgi:hypothetical protein